MRFTYVQQWTVKIIAIVVLVTISMRKNLYQLITKTITKLCNDSKSKRAFSQEINSSICIKVNSFTAISTNCIMTLIFQEFVSDIVSKYFPNDQPPWQYIIIPCVSTEPKYYVLVRVHHLLLSGKDSINIGDLLLVEQNSRERVVTQEYTQQSPLTKLFPTSSAIPELWGKLNENLSNAWNEFVSEYDPVESPRALKSLPGAFHVAGLVLISGVSALRELTKQSNGRTNPPITPTALIAAVQRECKRRNLTVPKVTFLLQNNSCNRSKSDSFTVSDNIITASDC